MARTWGRHTLLGGALVTGLLSVDMGESLAYQVFITILALLATLATGYLHAYESLQGPTEVLYWNRASAYDGYTFFGVRSNTYLLNMEGRVVHTWPLGTNPRLLTNGNILDSTSGDVSGFTTLKEVDWNGSTVWQYTEARTNYAPHHDFTRIYNPKLGTNTTLYIAAKAISSNACIAAGCNPANGPYTNAQVDAIVEVDMAGNVVWEWCFFDHGIQDFDASKSNYVGAGKSISNYVGRLNLNLPGRPVTNDWLHCNSIDYNQTLDQIVITAAGGEFYVIDHGNTFVAGNPAGSIALAAGSFLYVCLGELLPEGDKLVAHAHDRKYRAECFLGEDRHVVGDGAQLAGARDFKVADFTVDDISPEPKPPGEVLSSAIPCRTASRAPS